MPYCAVTDVQNLLSAMNIDLSTSTNISATEVTTEIIPMYDRYLDDRLGRYYQTPITGANALLTMNRIEKYLCAAEVAERVYVGQAPSDSPAGLAWRTLAEADITRLVDGDIILFDAVPTGETPEPEYSQVSDNLSAATRQTPPAFSMGMKF